MYLQSLMQHLVNVNIVLPLFNDINNPIREESLQYTRVSSIIDACVVDVNIYLHPKEAKLSSLTLLSPYPLLALGVD